MLALEIHEGCALMRLSYPMKITKPKNFFWEVWRQIIETLYQQNFSLYGIIITYNYISSGIIMYVFYFHSLFLSLTSLWSLCGLRAHPTTPT